MKSGHHNNRYTHKALLIFCFMFFCRAHGEVQEWLRFGKFEAGENKQYANLFRYS